MIGLAGTGDLVATALAPQSRNRRAGELLAEGVPAAEIPARVGQAVEALESVPLLAEALAEAGVEAPVTSALGRLISGELPLEEWVSVVRTTVPPPARWRPAVRTGFWKRLRERIRSWFRGKSPDGYEMFTGDEGGSVNLCPEPMPNGGEYASDSRDSGPA
jgi:glycerol-3-phosphate dehydrogenase (NAD(P)+)